MSDLMACPNCGTTYPYDATIQPGAPSPPRAKCPNCGLEIGIVPSGFRPVDVIGGNLANPPLQTLEEAREFEDAYVIIEADYGGQVYLTVPVAQVRCTENDLKVLALAIDDIEWSDPEGVAIYYQRHPAGIAIAGGGGGGQTTSELWVHPTVAHDGMGDTIAAVLAGRRSPSRVFEPDIARLRAVLTSPQTEVADFRKAIVQLFRVLGFHAREVPGGDSSNSIDFFVFLRDKERSIMGGCVVDASHLVTRIGSVVHEVIEVQKLNDRLTRMVVATRLTESKIPADAKRVARKARVAIIPIETLEMMTTLAPGEDTQSRIFRAFRGGHIGRL